MNQISIQCLILACGNTLREDDGVGPFLAQWAEERWRTDARVRILCDHQWTPEMVEEVAQAESVIFIDCATDCAPGLVRIRPVDTAGADSKIGTHHLDAGQLLALSQQLYGEMPRNSLLLTVGAYSLELREGFSDAVEAALQPACALLEKAVFEIIGKSINAGSPPV
jgi:hydrogenase maturation protease